MCGSFFGVYHNVVDVCLDKVICYLVFEACLNSILVGSPSVFKPERQGRVAIDAERRDEGCFYLVALVESDLVITRVAIEEGQ